MATPSVVIAGRLAASSRCAGVPALPVRLVAVLLDDGGVRVDHDDTVGSVDEDRGAVGDVEHVMTGADHCRYPEGAGEDRAVGEWAAGGGDDAEHLGWGRVAAAWVGVRSSVTTMPASVSVGPAAWPSRSASTWSPTARTSPARVWRYGIGELGEAAGERVDGDAPGVLGRDAVVPRSARARCRRARRRRGGAGGRRRSRPRARRRRRRRDLGSS